MFTCLTVQRLKKQYIRFAYLPAQKEPTLPAHSCANAEVSLTPLTIMLSAEDADGQELAPTRRLSTVPSFTVDVSWTPPELLGFNELLVWRRRNLPLLTLVDEL